MEDDTSAASEFLYMMSGIQEKWQNDNVANNEEKEQIVQAKPQMIIYYR